MTILKLFPRVLSSARRKTLLTGFLLLILVCPAAARRGDFALGLIFVEPTGISVKDWIGASASISGAAGWIPGQEDSFRIHADYIFQPVRIAEWDISKISFLYGLGTRILFREGIRMGARMPLGVEFISRARHLNFFFEIVPLFQFNPKARLFIRAGVGLRYILFPGG